MIYPQSESKCLGMRLREIDPAQTDTMEICDFSITIAKKNMNYIWKNLQLELEYSALFHWC